MARLYVVSTHLILIAGLFFVSPSPVFAKDAPEGYETTDPSAAELDPQLKEFPANNEGGDALGGWDLEFGGYVRTQFTAIENDPNYQLIGRRDGFSLAHVRLHFEGGTDEGFGFRIELDGAATLPQGDADAAVTLGARLRDSYLYYAPHPLIRASAGQFRAPFDIEELISTSSMVFIDRSVGNRGLSGVEALPVEGLSQGRQVGLRLDSKPFYFQGEPGDKDAQGFGLSYALALTNGQKINHRFNDNEKLAYYGRLNLHWADMVQLGGGGFHNERMLGAAPDRLSETRAGWTADLSVQLYGVTLLTNIIQTEITPAPELQAEQSRTARAIQAQIAYEEPFFGLQPAYRIALYDPDVDADDSISPAFEKLTYHTLGLNYNAPDFPVRLMLNYTITNEENVEIDNNRLDALAQIAW